MAPTRDIKTLATIVKKAMSEVLVITRDMRVSMAPIGIILVMVLNRVHTAISAITTGTEDSREDMVIETSHPALVTTTTLTKPETAFHRTKNMNSKWPRPGLNQFPSLGGVLLMKMFSLLRTRIELPNARLVAAGLLTKNQKETTTTGRRLGMNLAVNLVMAFNLVSKAETEGSIIGTTINREITEVVIRKEEIREMGIKVIKDSKAITMTDKEMTGSTSLPQLTPPNWLSKRLPPTTSLRGIPSELTTSP